MNQNLHVASPLTLPEAHGAVVECGGGGHRRAGADPHGGLGGIKPPYLPNTHGYPPKPPLYYLDETMKRKRGGRRREEEKEEESGHDPPLHF